MLFMLFDTPKIVSGGRFFHVHLVDSKLNLLARGHRVEFSVVEGEKREGEEDFMTAQRHFLRSAGSQKSVLVRCDAYCIALLDSYIYKKSACPEPRFFWTDPR